MKLKEALEAGKSARSVEFDAPEDYEFVQTLTLLTAKPRAVCRKRHRG